MKRLLPHRSNQVGFTLIELLVVIIILGILSAVVVFAVRGADDKGRENAIATDRRIIRTAMETYCAQKGTYPVDPPDVPAGSGRPDAMDVLVNEEFLSNRSGYHGLATGPKSAAYPEGKCTDLGYKLIGPGGGGTQNPEDPTCVRLNAQGVEEAVKATADMWCLGDSPKYWSGTFGENNLVLMQNGQALAITGVKQGLPPEVVLGQVSTSGYQTEIFDPTTGLKGAWRDGPIARANGNASPRGLLLIDGDDTQCGERCGNVMVHIPQAFGSGHWKLYDPDGDDGVPGTPGAWGIITPPSPFFATGAFVTAIQLLGPGCAPHCGKVLTVCGCNHPSSVAQLYDPVTNAFEPPFVYGTGGDYRDPLVHELPDGRVLLTTRQFGTSRPTFLLNVDNSTAEPIDEPVGHYLIGAKAAQLPDDRGILFLYSGEFAEIYKPETGGKGGWERLTRTCAGTDPTKYCNLLAQLPDGRILVNRSESSTRRGSEILIFDVTQADPNSQWSDAAAPNSSDSVGHSVLLSRSPCGVNCNRVLTLPRQITATTKSELYSP